MRTRLAALAVGIATVLTFGVGVALAAPGGTGTWASHDAMHSSEQMRAMHAQMPAQAEGCPQAPDGLADGDAMHAQMPAQMGQMHGGGWTGPMHSLGR
jgi:hypothetical protein